MDLKFNGGRGQVPAVCVCVCEGPWGGEGGASATRQLVTGASG